ncbi:neutral zinc metallopeptidase [Propioniciclava sp.]|uniref:KPN_02809 family neutral zinc metallopeptidase n=1 Tax=Propioniciclava sp. TaxID=2038686 RepID=UPI002627BBC0|nr:neutral zinc metallopeptidase [Propioniciclava sp.]
MEFNRSARLDPSQMRGGGGGGRGGPIAVGGGAGLIILILALLFGFDPGALLGGGTTAPTDTSTNQYAHCQTGADLENDPECRWVAYTNSIQSYWSGAVNGYQEASTTTFTGSVNTACGQATSQVGPFYCPADQIVYLDTTFFEGLLTQLGAQHTYAAEAYVLAHEYGHHISNLTGVMSQVQAQGQTTGPTSPGVRLELQADCYAGVWFRHADSDPNSPISNITQEDLNSAQEAASAVGDDRIQAKTQGQVTPETWSHGSSQMRQYWLARGFESGDPNQCDTFSTDNLGA